MFQYFYGERMNLCVGPGPTELHVPCSHSMVNPQEVQICCNTILKL